MDIMNSNQQHKKSYSLLPVEKQLLEATSVQERTSYLPPVNKLQLKIIKKRLFVRSIPDSYKHLRIILFGIFMQAYTHKPQLLNEMKKVIYECSQLGDSNFKDSKLVKNINQVPFDDGINTETAVMDLFMDASDFEILGPFSQNIVKNSKNYQNLEQCKQWFQSYFNLKIEILQISQASNQNICFYLNDNILLKGSLQSIDSLEGVSLDSDINTPIVSSKNCDLGSKQRKMNEFEDISLSKQNIRLSASEHYANIQIDNSAVQDFSAKSSPRQNSKIQSQSLRKKQNSNESFSLWNYLCC